MNNEELDESWIICREIYSVLNNLYILKHDRNEFCRESRFAACMFESSSFFSFLILSLINGTTTH
jgi:hypothetical protein